MSGYERSAAVDRLERLLDTIETERMPVPVREVWVFGDLAIGMDPVDRLDIYLTKDILLRDDTRTRYSDTEISTMNDRIGVEGIGSTVRADWAASYPEYIRANENGHVAPERCLGAQLLDPDEPIHLEVCNASFEDNVTQRLRGATLRDDFTQLLDPRGVCLWIDGTWSETAFEKLRESAFALPTLSDSLEMLGLDESEADRAAKAVHEWRSTQDGVSIRGDVI